jgi:hypothetical protein
LRNTYSPALPNNHLVDVQIKSKCDEEDVSIGGLILLYL